MGLKLLFYKIFQSAFLSKNQFLQRRRIFYLTGLTNYFKEYSCDKFCSGHDASGILGDAKISLIKKSAIPPPNSIK